MLKSRDLCISASPLFGRAMAGCRGGLKGLAKSDDPFCLWMRRDGAGLRPGFWVWPSGGCALIGRGIGRPFLSRRCFHVSLANVGGYFEACLALFVSFVSKHRHFRSCFVSRNKTWPCACSLFVSQHETKTFPVVALVACVFCFEIKILKRISLSWDCFCFCAGALA